MSIGQQQAADAAKDLTAAYSVHIPGTPVAVSTMRRTGETALAMGFRLQTGYAQLSEVADHGMDLADLRKMLNAGELPDAAVTRAEMLLSSPMEERIWITHGLVIAGLCKVLGLQEDHERLVPRFCEIRELPID
jgi:hypothetical protein